MTLSRSGSIKLFGDYPRLLLGGGGVFLVLVVAFISIFWTPASPTDMDISTRLQGPALRHPLGTDQYGRDELSRLMKGSTASISVALAAVGIGALAGIALGVAATTTGYALQETILRLVDALYALPAVLLALLITALLGPGIRNSTLAIGIFNIPVFARLTRGTLLSIQNKEYLVAARAVGVGFYGRAFRYLLPNAASTLVVQLSNSFARALLAEAGLSYLGLGIQPPNPSWGTMLKNAQTFINQQPLLIIYPGLAIMFTVLSFNLLADGLRDFLDPFLIARRD
ncbi:MAG: ABC transporter permease [Candidatus Bipolaricaulota bacterium]